MMMPWYGAVHGSKQRAAHAGAWVASMHPIGGGPVPVCTVCLNHLWLLWPCPAGTNPAPAPVHAAPPPSSPPVQPCVLFVGEKFESVPALKLAKSLLLDFFRGEHVESINLAGVDRVLMAVAEDDERISLRQYSIRFKKSGSRTPRVALSEMGPRMGLAVRRHRTAPPDLVSDAMAKKVLKKKVRTDRAACADRSIYPLFLCVCVHACMHGWMLASGHPAR